MKLKKWSSQTPVPWSNTWIPFGTYASNEPPTEDKVVQINLRDEANFKPIFIGESLSPSKKEDLTHLIWEYIDVFTWNYEDIHGLDPQVAMHHLNINPDAKPVKQQQRQFCPEIIETIESEVKKLIDSDFIREEQHPDRVANIVPVLRRTRIYWLLRSERCLSQRWVIASDYECHDWQYVRIREDVLHGWLFRV